jgi:hypothetical protein
MPSPYNDRLRTLEMRDKKAFGESKVFVLGESSQYLYLTVINGKESNAVQMSKNEILFLKTAEKIN